MSRYLVVCAALVGCIDEVGYGEDTQAIEGGVDDESSPEHNATVRVQGCTGTLVAPDLVLTAAHCFAPPVPPDLRPASVEAGTSNGTMFYAAHRMELWSHVLGDVFVRPWSAVRTDPDLVSMTGIAGTMYATNSGGQLLYRPVLAKATTDWTVIGSTLVPAGVLSITASDAQLYAVTSTGWLYQRDRVHVDAAWFCVGAASGIRAIAIDDHDNLYGVSSTGRLMLRGAKAWRDIGPATGVRSIDYDDGFLFAVTDSRVLARRSVPWDVKWQDRGTAGTPIEIAAIDGRLYRLDSGGAIHRRDAQLKWTRSAGSLPEYTTTGIAFANGDLFVRGSSGKLWARGATAWGDPWVVVEQSTVVMPSLAAADGYIYAVWQWGGTLFGVYRRPATRAAASWSIVRSNADDLGIEKIVIYDGYIYGKARDGKLYRRTLDGSTSTLFVQIGSGNCAALGGANGKLYCADAYATLHERAASGDTANFTGLPRFDWQRPDVLNPLDAGVYFGNDQATSSGYARVTGYYHGGEIDAFLLQLDRTVSGYVATPARPVTRTPSADPTAFWAAQSFGMAGWGMMSSNPNQLYRRDSTGTFTNLGDFSNGPIDIEIDGDRIYVITSVGGFGWWSLSDLSSHEVGDAQADLIALGVPRAGELYGASATRIYRYNVAGDYWQSHASVPLTTDEKVTAMAAGADYVYVATSDHRLLRMSGTTWTNLGWVPTTKAMTADATNLYLVMDTGWLYRRTASGGWAYLGLAEGKNAIAVASGTIYATSPGTPRIRQWATATGGTYPYAGSYRRMQVHGDEAWIHPGDSGGPLYWRDTAGALRVVGITQQENAEGGIYTVTFSESQASPGSLAPSPNVGGWLDYHVP